MSIKLLIENPDGSAFVDLQTYIAEQIDLEMKSYVHGAITSMVSDAVNRELKDTNFRDHIDVPSSSKIRQIAEESCVTKDDFESSVDDRSRQACEDWLGDQQDKGKIMNAEIFKKVFAQTVEAMFRYREEGEHQTGNPAPEPEATT